MPFTTRDGVRLHWEEQGSGSPVLLCMGASYSSVMWYPAIPALAEKHRVIWFDNRGTGESEASQVASIADMAADACAVLDAAGVDSAHVYGVSLGGVVAQQLALQAPERVRGLVLGCTGILDEDKPRLPRWLQVLLTRLPVRVLTVLTSRGAYGSACTPERRARNEEVLASVVTSETAVRQQQDALRAYSVSKDQMAALPMPTLVLHGTEDRRVKHAWGEELAATIPGARFISYPGAAHNYLVDVGDQPNDDVLAFLAEVDSSVTA
jgi:3-oxoadipate enol-lactonase